MDPIEKTSHAQGALPAANAARPGSSQDARRASDRKPWLESLGPEADQERLAEERAVDYAENAGVSGFEALVNAARSRNVENLRTLLAAGADNSWRAPTGRTPLMFAVQDDEPADVDFAKQLIAEGEAIEARDNSGRTPLALAAWRGSAPMVELLLNAGASPMTPDNFGCAPLHRAAESGSVRCVEAIARTGVPIDMLDHGGRTALLRAAESWRLESARALIEAGADPMIRDQRGKSAHSIAMGSGHKAMAALLDEAAQARASQASAPGMPRGAPLATTLMPRPASVAAAAAAPAADAAAQAMPTPAAPAAPVAAPAKASRPAPRLAR